MRSMPKLLSIVGAAGVLLVAGSALAQAPAPYGAPISLENAKKRRRRPRQRRAKTIGPW